MKKLADITNRMFGQPMFKLLSIAQQLEREGREIIHFEIGEPNFDSPSVAVKAACDALTSGKTHYVNSLGLLELRQAIAEYTQGDLGFLPDLQQILVCPANAIVDFCVRCVANPGDEVLLPDPGFATYYSVLNYNNIVPVSIPLLESNGFKMNPMDVSQRVTGRTKLIILNSPQNPTGSVMDEQDILEITRIAEENDLFILSDEVYSKLIFDRTHYSAAVVDRCLERTILLQSFSKTYSMTGWRLGYAIGPIQLIEKMGLLLQTTLSCLPEFTQMGAIAALRDTEFTAPHLTELRARRDLLLAGLNNIRGVHCVKPDGAFYLFPRIESVKMTGFEYSERILQEEGLCILPGSSFGKCGSGFMRMSYSNITTEQINKTLKKMHRFHNQYF